MIRRYLSDAAIEHGMQSWGSKEGKMRGRTGL